MKKQILWAFLFGMFGIGLAQAYEVDVKFTFNNLGCDEYVDIYLVNPAGSASKQWRTTSDAHRVEPLEVSFSQPDPGPYFIQLVACSPCSGDPPPTTPPFGSGEVYLTLNPAGD